MRQLIIVSLDGREIVVVVYPPGQEESLAAEVRGCEAAGLWFGVYDFDILSYEATWN
jgi:hypothetical protein